MTGIYSQLVSAIYNGIDNNFRFQLNNCGRIEAFDPKWAGARQSIGNFVGNIVNQDSNAKQLVTYSGYFTVEDVSAILLDLVWQKIHDKLDLYDTITHYKEYKIQLSDDKLLTDKTN